MKLLLTLVITSVLLSGCASNVKYDPKPYNKNNSFAYNVMNISSPVPWDLMDAQAAIPESYKKDRSWGFEASQALVGASQNMSSIGSILSGGASMGLLALALPETPGTRSTPWTIMFIDADKLNNKSGDMKENALKIFSEKALNIIKDNYMNIPGNESIELKSDILFEDSVLIGHWYRLPFINANPSTPLLRCNKKCTSQARIGDLSLSGPYSTKIEGINVTEMEYYVVAYRFNMNGYEPLKIYNYSSFFGDDLFFYHPAYTFDGKLTKGIPSLISSEGVHLFVKPTTPLIGQVQ